MIDVLAQAVVRVPYLMGEQFTAADVVIGSGLRWGMMFKLLPAVDLQWSDVWTGALVTALLFTLGKFLIGYYLGKSNVASSYGAAASIITSSASTALSAG